MMTAAFVLKPDEIALMGFDKVLHPEIKGNQEGKWGDENKWGHSSAAEQKAIAGLGIKIVDLYEELTNARVH